MHALVLLCINHRTFEMPSFTNSTDEIGGKISFKNESCNPDHAN